MKTVYCLQKGMTRRIFHKDTEQLYSWVSGKCWLTTPPTQPAANQNHGKDHCLGGGHQTSTTLPAALWSSSELCRSVPHFVPLWYSSAGWLLCGKSSVWLCLGMYKILESWRSKELLWNTSWGLKAPLVPCISISGPPLTQLYNLPSPKMQMKEEFSPYYWKALSQFPCSALWKKRSLQVNEYLHLQQFEVKILFQEPLCSFLEPGGVKACSGTAAYAPCFCA